MFQVMWVDGPVTYMAATIDGLEVDEVEEFFMMWSEWCE